MQSFLIICLVSQNGLICGGFISSEMSQSAGGRLMCGGLSTEFYGKLITIQ